MQNEEFKNVVDENSDEFVSEALIQSTLAEMGQSELEQSENTEVTNLPKPKIKAKDKDREKEREKDKDKDKDKDRENKELLKNLGKHKLLFDLKEFQDTYKKFEDTFKKANSKSLGNKISRENIFSKLVELIDEQFILELQKASLSEAELNEILRGHFVQGQLKH